MIDPSFISTLLGTPKHLRVNIGDYLETTVYGPASGPYD